MDPFVLVFLAMAVFGGIIVGLFWAIMWAANRWIHPWSAVGFGWAMFAFLGYSMVSGIVSCSADPVYIPPTPEEAAWGSEGTMKFNCDAPGGAFDYFALYILIPIMMAATALLSLRFANRMVLPK